MTQEEFEEEIINAVKTSIFAYENYLTSDLVKIDQEGQVRNCANVLDPITGRVYGMMITVGPVDFFKRQIERDIAAGAVPIEPNLGIE